MAYSKDKRKNEEIAKCLFRFHEALQENGEHINLGPFIRILKKCSASEIETINQMFYDFEYYLKS